MTAEPGGQGAADATARGYLRASHTDREQVIGTLKAAFVQGRLTKDELDERAGRAFAARTYADLAAVTSDLPTGLIAAPPPGKPARPRARPRRPRARPPLGRVIAGAALIGTPPAMVAATFLTGSEFLPGPTVLVVVFFFMAWMVAGGQLLANWHDKRSRGQLPPQPAPGGHAVEGERDRGPGDDLILCQAHGDTRARRPFGAWRHPAHLAVRADSPG